MDTDKVISDLNKRFAQPLPPYYKRRVVFWLDEEQEYIDNWMILNFKMPA